MAAHPIIAERKLEALRHALGETVLAALVEPAVVEILANPDGRLILDRSGEGRQATVPSSKMTQPVFEQKRAKTHGHNNEPGFTRTGMSRNVSNILDASRVIRGTVSMRSHVIS